MLITSVTWRNNHSLPEVDTVTHPCTEFSSSHNKALCFPSLSNSQSLRDPQLLYIRDTCWSKPFWSWSQLATRFDGNTYLHRVIFKFICEGLLDYDCHHVSTILCVKRSIIQPIFMRVFDLSTAAVTRSRRIGVGFRHWCLQAILLQRIQSVAWFWTLHLSLNRHPLPEGDNTCDTSRWAHTSKYWIQCLRGSLQLAVWSD